MTELDAERTAAARRRASTRCPRTSVAQLRRLTLPQTFQSDVRNTEIVCATLGNDAGLIGAAML